MTQKIQSFSFHINLWPFVLHSSPEVGIESCGWKQSMSPLQHINTAQILQLTFSTEVFQWRRLSEHYFLYIATMPLPSFLIFDAVMQGYFSLYWVEFYSFLDSTIHGLPIMLIRGIKVSPFPIYLKSRDVWKLK